MKGNSESLDLLKNRQSLLKSELAASREKTVLLNGKLTEAKKVFGENSTEVQNLNRKLTEAKNVEAAIQNELGETNAKIKEQEQANSSLEQSISQADGKLQQFDKELQLNATRLEGTADKTDLLFQSTFPLQGTTGIQEHLLDLKYEAAPVILFLLNPRPCSNQNC